MTRKCTQVVPKVTRKTNWSEYLECVSEYLFTGPTSATWYPEPATWANKIWMGLELNGIVSPETKTPSSVDNKKLHLYLLRSIPMKSFLHYRIKEHTCLLHNFIVPSLSLGPTAIHWSRVSLRWVTPSWSWIPRTPLLPPTLGIHISNVSEKGIL